MPVGAAFKVAPTTNDIDSLKKAIATDWNPRQQAEITIYTKGPDSAWTSVTKQSTPLTANTEETPYGFSLPAKT